LVQPLEGFGLWSIRLSSKKSELLERMGVIFQGKQPFFAVCGLEWAASLANETVVLNTCLGQ
jgi:hypothetical protein